MKALLFNISGAAIGSWLVLWRALGDRSGWFGMLNAWAEWGIYLLAALGILRIAAGEKKSGFVMVAVAAIAAFRRDPTPNRTISAPLIQPSGAPFTLFSANLFKRNRSIARHIGMMRRHSPDVICLQEFSPKFEAELPPEFLRDYPFRALRPQKGSYGFGVYSRFPIEESGFWDRPGAHPWGQRVRVTLPTGEVVDIYNVHLFPPMADAAFTNGVTASFRDREEQVRIIQREIEQEGVPAIIIGDHNFSDTSDAYRIALEHWTDSWREAGQGVPYTWPLRAFPNKWVPVNPRMLRLDYCFHTGGVTTRSIQLLAKRTGSDHVPLLVELSVHGREAMAFPAATFDHGSETAAPS